ncbi:MAG: sigma-54-dependent Fis family transcriptional regulator [Planctomycetes bacterium]|nr:sigma-54-dependent Fis family transcriptional regulator [Planctomycetota bacterium]
MTRYRVLFCDDLKSDRDAFKRNVAARFEGVIESVLVSSFGGLEKEIAEGRRADVVITDVNFESIGGNPNEGKRIVQAAKEAWPEAQVVIFTARPRSLSAEEVLELSDLGLRRETWVNKIGDDGEEGWNRLAEVLDVLLRAIALHRRAREYRDLSVRDSIRLAAERGIAPAIPDERFAEFPDMLGKSPAMREVYDRVRRVAPTPAPVLLLGESGSGKELVARAVHALSGRRGRFVDVNCSEFTRELLAAELFGHVRGAFTGADSDREGLFASANGGTFLLDEIGEMTPENQAKLLRAIETGEVRPVGSSTTRSIDVRVIAATNRNLRLEVEEGRFRRDLLSRIGAYPIHLPPLRERPEDVPLAICHFLAELRERYKKPVKRIEEAALARLVARRWTGNIRELRNVAIRILVNLDPGADTIRESDLPPDEGDAAAPGAESGEDLFARILDGRLKMSLPSLAKSFGKPVAIELARRTMLHFEGLPDEETCRRLFGMSYRSWQHWAHYNGLTWKKVKDGQGSM